jgi:hypothetical protein
MFFMKELLASDHGDLFAVEQMLMRLELLDPLLVKQLLELHLQSPSNHHHLALEKHHQVPA